MQRLLLSRLGLLGIVYVVKLTTLEGNGTYEMVTYSTSHPLEVPLKSPKSVQQDSSTGDLYIAEFGGGSINKLTPSGSLTLLLPSGAFPRDTAQCTRFRPERCGYGF
jgi:hypothetical protein